MAHNYITAAALERWLSGREQQNDTLFMAGKCPLWSICFYQMIQWGEGFPFSIWAFQILLALFGIPLMDNYLLAGIENSMFSVQRCGKSLLCIHSTAGLSSEEPVFWLNEICYSEHVMWQIVTVIHMEHLPPRPGTVAQDGHLQATCQRAAANMLADNC